MILFGLIIGLIYRICMEGAAGILTFLIQSILPVILLFLLFRMRALGAGDIKLFSLIGCFCSFEELFYCIAASFVVGAIFSLLKMLADRTLYFRIWRFFHYLYQLCINRQFEPYWADRKEADNIIHFSIAVWFGYLISLGVCD